MLQWFSNALAKALVASDTNPIPVTLIGGAPSISFTTVPASAAATGTSGQMAVGGGYLYVCTATNTWRRVALTTF